MLIGILSHEGQALAVRRKGHGAVHILDELSGSTSEHGHLMQHPKPRVFALASDVIDVVAIGGES